MDWNSFSSSSMSARTAAQYHSYSSAPFATHARPSADRAYTHPPYEANVDVSSTRPSSSNRNSNVSWTSFPFPLLYIFAYSVSPLHQYRRCCSPALCSNSHNNGMAVLSLLRRAGIVAMRCSQRSSTLLIRKTCIEWSRRPAICSRKRGELRPPIPSLFLDPRILAHTLIITGAVRKR